MKKGKGQPTPWEVEMEMKLAMLRQFPAGTLMGDLIRRDEMMKMLKEIETVFGKDGAKKFLGIE